ncbi:HAD family phosphatase [Flavobacteriaceae bacterium]|jgi:beta-phosphoglucomutase|nr:HAD family phosphatase [Flavobacteriaceae bacterium]MDA8644703.1 HAD family phosphatase [Flavobacteriaceae bacterium]MDA9851712.1 HAD family phosphatase [Flavobacteriaceae bacterium]MDC0386588.1 HAD family phosphatase [Flavobacteriaceae bacterium]MDC0872870.1 HAD family phosphatase [Flavobacteriaceae bacterium]
MIKAVIFDMDGVIINSEPMHQKAYRMMFEKFNLNVSEQLYTSFTGMATLPICEKLCEVFALDHSPQVLVDSKRYFFKQLFENGEELKLIDGVLELIQHYHQLKITLILASSASMANINMTFQKFNLDPYFKAKISGAELKASKPHPEIFEKAVTLSGVSKEACFVIEDATNGIIAAKAAGLFCVAFDGGHSQHQNYTQADRVVTDFKSLQLENLKQLFEN